MKPSHAVVGMGLVALATGLISLVSLAAPEPSPMTTTDQPAADIPAPVARVLDEFGVHLVTAPGAAP